jgi:uncharacterized delta-60 repeat protein
MRAYVRAFISLTACLLPFTAGATDGYFDTTWAGGGRIAFDADFHNPDYSFAYQIIVDTNGELLLGGGARVQQGPFYWWLGKMRANGAPVPTFGESNGTGLVTGCWLSPGLCATGPLRELLTQGDGRIAVVADNVLSRTAPDAHALDAGGVTGGTGSVNLSFGINNVQGRMLAGYAIAPTQSGQWLVAGSGRYSAAATNTDYAAVRLQPDYGLDTAFNASTDGSGVTFAGGQIISAGPATNAKLTKAFVQQGDRLLMFGGTDSGSVLIRLLSDGAPDPDFDTGGKKGSPCRFSDVPGGVIRDRAGRYVAACTAGSPPSMRLVRFNADGTPDGNFGLAGVVSVAMPRDVPVSCDAGGSYAVSIDSAGRILASGSCASIFGTGPANTTFLVIRLHGDDGSLDTSFGIGGFAYGHFAASSLNDYAFAIAMDAGGRPVIAGQSDVRVGVARLGYDLIFTNDMEKIPRGRLSGQ